MENVLVWPFGDDWRPGVCALYKMKICRFIYNRDGIFETGGNAVSYAIIVCAEDYCEIVLKLMLSSL